MIDQDSIRHKGLKEFYEKGRSKSVPQMLSNRIVNRMAALEAAREIGDLNTPSLRVHKLAGRQRGRFAIWVNGPWRMTFRFRAETVYDLDLEQYH